MPTNAVEHPVDPTTMTEDNDTGTNIDIGITKRRIQRDDHVDIGTVTMTGKGREIKDNSKSYFSQPNKLDK